MVLRIKEIYGKADKRHRKCKKILHLRRQEGRMIFIERGYEV